MLASVKPKKYLGQHFLTDGNIAIKIVNALKNESGGRVLEIGAGTGVLTKHLLSLHKDFKAFDVDLESIEYLKATYPEHAGKFIFKDYLKEQLEEDSVCVIGNFPYNISSQLFFKIWDDRNKVDEVVCMIQKEVADRIVAKHGNKIYGILSVLLQVFYDIELLFNVPPSVFNPPPKVQSAVIRLVRNDTHHLPCDEDMFKKVVKAGFGKRRKTLKNALKDLNLSALDRLGDMLDKRAEQLSVSEFVALTSKITA